MSYEFKKLSDVETVEAPAEAANVLFEEKGVIKKAPKSVFGGGSGGGGDNNIVINIRTNENGDMETETRGNLNYILNATCSKTFDEIVDLWRNYSIGAVTINRYAWGSVQSYDNTGCASGLDFRNESGEVNHYEEGVPTQITVCYMYDGVDKYLYIFPDGITTNHGREG